MERNVHDMEKRLESVYRRINGEVVESRLGRVNYSQYIGNENRKFILSFLNVAKARVPTETRVLFYANQMWVISKLIKTHMNDKSIKNFTKDDVDQFVGLIKTIKNKDGEHYSDNSIHGILIVFKKAMQYAKGYSWNSKKYPLEVEDIRHTVKKDTQKLPEQLITREDIEAMSLATKNIRDKALVHTLYESGTRISEFLKMKIRDIAFDDFGAVLLVPFGKTGRRKIRLVTSSSLLSQWIMTHPEKDNLDAWIWCKNKTEQNRTKIERITYNGIRAIIERLRKRAKINKEIHMHLFRHSRMSELAKVLTESQLCAFAGWVQGSEMSRVYVHLSMRDMDDAILSANGIKRIDTKEQSVRTCVRCKTKNHSVSKMCSQCMLPLDDKSAIEFEERKVLTIPEKYEKILLEILQKPENVKLLKDKMT